MNPDRPAGAPRLPGMAGSPGATQTPGARRHAPSAPALIAVLSLVLMGACASTVGDAGPLPTPTPASPVPASAAASVAPGGSAVPTPTPASSLPVPASPAFTPPASTATTTIYLLQGEQLVPVHRTVAPTIAVASAAMRALLAGPTNAEMSTIDASGTALKPLGTAIPQGTLLLGISIANGVARVDLSREFESGGGSASMFARLAQVVYTMTQFPTVQGVTLMLDGQEVTTFSSEGIVIDRPLTRADYEGNLPAIFVDAPSWDAPVASPLRISGTADVFEAQFSVEITTVDGAVLATAPVKASCGTGCRGTFSVTVPFTVGRVQPGFVTVYDASAKDGSRENVRTYPVTLTPGA